MGEIEEQLLFSSTLIMIALLICFAIGSYFNIETYLNSFGYISVVLSLIVLVLSTCVKLKRHAQKNKSYAMVYSVIIAIFMQQLELHVSLMQVNLSILSVRQLFY